MKITIDGPSGVGKSTIADLLSKKLGLDYLDTGAMYRALTLFLIENNIDLSNESIVCECIDEANIDYRRGSTYLNGRDVSIEIREPLVTNSVSRVASLACVREKLVKSQREIIADGGILDGRDTGSVVVPNADYKFYLQADPKIRAQRRFEQNSGGRSIEEIYQMILDRDEKDMNRQHSPLVVPEGAIIIDSSNLSVEETLKEILKHVR